MTAARTCSLNVMLQIQCSTYRHVSVKKKNSKECGQSCLITARRKQRYTAVKGCVHTRDGCLLALTVFTRKSRKDEEKMLSPYICCTATGALCPSWRQREGGGRLKKHTKSKPLSQATGTNQKNQNKKKSKRRAKQKEKKQNNKKKNRKNPLRTDRERCGGWASNGYHLLVFSRGCLLF